MSRKLKNPYADKQKRDKLSAVDRPDPDKMSWFDKLMIADLGCTALSCCSWQMIMFVAVAVIAAVLIW